MDDLLALFEENPEELARDAATTANHNHNNHPSPPTSPPPSSATSGGAGAGANLDNRLGIRVTQYQQTNSLELLDIITSQPFVTPAALCAASLKTLNKYLVEPASVLDAACVAGPTTIGTVGTLFGSSGTRVTKTSGAAFVKLELGTLVTGPCVTVLLFGHAYRHFAAQKVALGSVLLLRNPRLMPSSPQQQQDAHRITLSLNDPQQIVVVGKDRDYGCCRATVSGKDPDTGQWVSNFKQCPNFVDKRQGSYCAKHCKQQHHRHSSSNNNNTNKLQMLREEHAPAAAARPGERRMILPSNAPQQPLSQQPPPASRSEQMMASYNQKYGTRSYFASSSSSSSANGSRNPLHANQQQPHDPSQPFDRGLVRPLTSTQARSGPQQQSRHDHNQGKSCINSKNVENRGSSQKITTQFQKNPYQRVKRSVMVTPKTATPCSSDSAAKQKHNNNNSNQTVNLDHIILQPSSSLKQRKKKRSQQPEPSGQESILGSRGRHGHQERRSSLVNTDTGGFDGSVCVPKPKRFRVPHTTPVLQQRSSIHNKAEEEEEDPRKSRVATEILAKQQKLSQGLMMMNSSSHHKNSNNRKSANSNNSERDEREALLFESVTQADLERADHASSQFTDQAKAEDYAIHRRTLVELEKKEARQEKQKSKQPQRPQSNNNKTKTRIQKEWHCVDCGRTYHHQVPLSCQKQNHRIVRQRQVRQAQSLEEKRQSMNDSNGTLQIGSGLQWSQWPSRFN